MWKTLPGRLYMEYYQQRHQDSNTKNVLVKEDNSLELTRSQNSVFLQSVIKAEYDWEYLIVEMNCELVVSFRIFIQSPLSTANLDIANNTI
jgi:hypothetical protein